MEKKQDPTSALGPDEHECFPTPKAACFVTAYHVALFVVMGVSLYYLYEQDGGLKEGGLKECLTSLVFGALGGTMMACRYVVYAVRHNRYGHHLLLWQIMTPIFSAVLAPIGMIAVRAGMLTLTNTPELSEPRYTYFLMIFSFLVGFCSESFIKRLIMAFEALLGERGDLDP